MGTTAEPTRPAGTFARDIYERLLIDLAWSSSRLEGNTYNRLDTQNLLEHGIRAEGKDASDAQMLLNHKKAIAARGEYLAGESQLMSAVIYRRARASLRRRHTRGV